MPKNFPFHAAAKAGLVALIAAVGAYRLATQVSYYDGCNTLSLGGAYTLLGCLEPQAAIDARAAYVVFGKEYRTSEAYGWPRHVKPMIALFHAVQKVVWR